MSDLETLSHLPDNEGEAQPVIFFLSMKDLIIFGLIALLFLDMFLGWRSKEGHLNHLVGVVSYDAVIDGLMIDQNGATGIKEVNDLKLALAMSYYDVTLEKIISEGHVDAIVNAFDIIQTNNSASRSFTNIDELVVSEIRLQAKNDERINKLGGMGL